MTETAPIARLDTDDLNERTDGGRFAFRSKRYGQDLGLQATGLSLYVVPPGKTAFPYHRHSMIEEVLVILEGEGTRRLDDQEYAVRAGDIVAARCGEAHQLTNTGDTDLRYLAFSNMPAADVVHYPDSGKVLSFAMNLDGLIHISRLDDAVDYYDGES